MRNEEAGTGVTRPSGEDAEPIPDIRPWRESGWIFRDGDVQAVERRDDRTRVCAAPEREE
jgi:hypothetical protein